MASRTDGPPDDQPVLVIASSWLMIGGASLGAVLALGFAVLLFVVNGWTVVSAIVGALAVSLTAVVVFDLPVSAEFRRDGVERRAMLRRHTIPWSRVRRLSRVRSGILRTFRAEVRGGLVADVGGRSYLLVDRTESPIEFDELRRVVGADQADRLGLVDTLRPGYRNPDATGLTSWWRSWSRRSGGGVGR